MRYYAAPAREMKNRGVRRRVIIQETSAFAWMRYGFPVGISCLSALLLFSGLPSLAKVVLFPFVLGIVGLASYTTWHNIVSASQGIMQIERRGVWIGHLDRTVPWRNIRNAFTEEIPLPEKVAERLPEGVGLIRTTIRVDDPSIAVSERRKIMDMTDPVMILNRVLTRRLLRAKGTKVRAEAAKHPDHGLIHVMGASAQGEVAPLVGLAKKALMAEAKGKRDG